MAPEKGHGVNLNWQRAKKEVLAKKGKYFQSQEKKRQNQSAKYKAEDFEHGNKRNHAEIKATKRKNSRRQGEKKGVRSSHCKDELRRTIDWS